MSKTQFLTVALWLWSMLAVAQNVNISASYNDKDGVSHTVDSSIDDAEAPLGVEFKANPSDMGDWTPSYEWHFQRVEKGVAPTDIFVRYEENTSFTFMESGTYKVILKTRLTQPGDQVDLDDQFITITIVESRLEFPNAFSPNNDGINDVYRAKPDYKSIVSFRAIILNRWGQKLYEWNDPAGGWDGKYHGNDVKEGVYFVLVEAKGADGKEYKIRKDVNLLRGFIEKTTTK